METKLNLLTKFDDVLNLFIAQIKVLTNFALLTSN